jgi:AcrR family transcriptional regulator
MHRGNRHGRSEAARLSVLEAADDLLAEKGFAQLTIEGIAQRAGVAKQTIYRWWSSKTEILLDAFLTGTADDPDPQDTGNVADDYRAHLAALAHFLTESDAGAVFRVLNAEGQHDPALADRLRSGHLGRQRVRDRRPLEQAVERGALPAGTDLDALVDRLVAPIYYRALVTGQEIPADFIDSLVTATLPRASRA